MTTASPEERARVAEFGMYRPDLESDACGVGLIAATDGKASRRVVTAAIDALKAVWHRGAVDADGKTGDGAGLHVELPVDFFVEHIGRAGHAPKPNRLAVGMIFLPRTDLAAQETCRTIVESEIIGFGYSIYGWRQVPVDTSVIGTKAMASRPEIEQIMVAGPLGGDVEAFEKDLFLIRRRIEKAVVAAQIQGFYVCSLSARSIIYKGLFLAEELAVFYPDLNDPRFTSRFAIYHQRYSTNTFPQWWLAQPFRCLAHNGEINTVRGNKNWMKSHEIKMAASAFGEHSADIKPLIPAGASDTAALDAVFEAFVRSGRDAPTAKLMLIPEAWNGDDSMPEAHRAMYAFFASVMEAWDGPAALAMTDGRWCLAGVDRSALRPMRWLTTNDGLLITGSEAGMVVVPETSITAKGALGPGQMIAVDLDGDDGSGARLYTDRAVKDRIAAAAPYAGWVEHFRTFADLPGHDAPQPAAAFDRAELRRRQVAAGLTAEDMELLLAPMVEDAKEAIGSMGDDTPLAVISSRPRSLSHFFRQNFSQVTNPPINSLRETRVMSLKTRFANFGNILDHDARQDGVMVLDSPVLTNRDWAVLQAHYARGAAVIDCTFDIAAGPEALRAAIARVRSEAEIAVRSGKSQLFLTDENVSRDRAGITMILAAAGVHTHLVAKGLRAFASINVRSAECLDTHYFAVLIGVGATTVNAYLAQEAIFDRHARGLFAGRSLDDCVARYKKAVEDGLLKIMGKMGISVVSSYRGGYNFEAVGLSRALVNDFFPGMPAKISGEGFASLHLNARDRHELAWDEDVIALPVGGLYRYRSGAEDHAYQANLIHLLQTAVTNDSYSDYTRFSRAVAELPPIYLRDLLEFNWARVPGRVDAVEFDHRNPPPLRHAGDELGGARPRSARNAGDRDEPHRRQGGQRRRRRGQRALHALCQRRQRQFGGQAGRVGAVRRHGGISERLHRDRDQGRARGQARRGRAAAGVQGHRPDRPPAPLDAGRDADLAAAAPRYLFDRGPRAADLRPQADQSGRAGLRQAGEFGRDRHGRGGRRQGARRRHPRLRAMSAAPPRRRSRRSNMPARRGRWACRRSTRC